MQQLIFISPSGVLAFLLTLRAQTVAAIAYYNSSGALYVKPDSGSNSSKSWSDAQSYCKSLSSTLGVLDTPNQRQSFIEALNHFGYDTTDTWIGANAYYGGANNWRWLNGANYSGPGKFFLPAGIAICCHDSSHVVDT